MEANTNDVGNDQSIVFATIGILFIRIVVKKNIFYLLDEGNQYNTVEPCVVGDYLLLSDIEWQRLAASDEKENMPQNEMVCVNVEAEACGQLVTESIENQYVDTDGVIADFENNEGIFLVIIFD